MDSSVSSFSTSFGYNFSFMLIARSLSFGINFYMLRAVDHDVLGIATVRLYLLYTTILFLVREPFRRACLSSSTEKKDDLSADNPLVDVAGGGDKQPTPPTTCKDCDQDTSVSNEADVEHPVQRQRLVNLLWFCPIMAIALSCLLVTIWQFGLSRPTQSIDRIYDRALFGFAAAALIETLAEPLWIYAQKLYLVKFVAVLNGLHVFVERVIVAVLIMTGVVSQLDAFVIALIVSSLLYTLAFYYRFWSLIRSGDKSIPLRSIKDLLPGNWSVGYDESRWMLARSFIAHSAVKQLLTDGAGYVMTFFNLLSFADQGIFNAIEKLGSLVARILLAPLEESAYVYFSRNIDRNLRADQQNPIKYRVAMLVLRGLLRSTAVIGLTVCIFGCSYSYLALLIYGGHNLVANNGARLLRAYCVYVWLLAVNGVTECFAFATMRKDQVTSHRHFLFVFSGFYLVAQAGFASYFGAVGFIVANAFNMAARILYSLIHIHKFTASGCDMLMAEADLRGDGWVPSDGESPLWQLIPNMTTSTVLAFSLFFTSLSSSLFCCIFLTAAHLAVGGVAFGSTCVVILQTDFELVEFIDRFVFHSKAE